MGVFEHDEYRGHEHVAFVGDDATGLRGIIALHNTVLGPAGGDIRFFPYPSSDEALGDVLRLSRAMTLKMALAGIPFGGGKAVIIGDPETDKTEPLLEAFGRAMDALDGDAQARQVVLARPVRDGGAQRVEDAFAGGGRRIAGGVRTSRHIGGHAVDHGHVLGRRAHVFAADEAALQGVGNVGSTLCGHLAAHGAELFVTDVNDEAIGRAVDRFGATAVATEDVLGLDVDVLAPCALGGVLNDDTVPALKARIVCGGANNQLAEDQHADALAARDVLFVPDFLANAGGVISGTSPFLGRDAAAVSAGVAAIYDTCARVLDLAETESITPNAAAERVVEETLAARRAGV